MNLTKDAIDLSSDEAAQQKCFHLLMKSVTYLYPEDPSCPGILQSQLKNGDYYISINRFKKPYGGDRQIVFRVKDKNYGVALKKAAAFIIKQRPTRSPLDELSTVLEYM